MMNNKLPAMATFLKNGPRSLRLSNCTDSVIGISINSKIIAAFFHTILRQASRRSKHYNTGKIN